MDKINELRELSNSQTKKDNLYNCYPIFIIQDIESVGLLNEEYHGEEERCDGYSQYIYCYDTENYTRDEALVKISEAIEEGRTETLEAIEEYPEYKTEHSDLKEVWESLSERYGYTTAAGLCKYIYTDREWFLTKARAEGYLENRRYRYKNPRIYIKSFTESDFLDILRELGFKHYG